MQSSFRRHHLEGSITWSVFNPPELSSVLSTTLKFQPCLYYIFLLSNMRDYTRNFQPRAKFNLWVEISALFQLPGQKFLPWVELSPAWVEILSCNRSQSWAEIRHASMRENENLRCMTNYNILNKSRRRRRKSSKI